MLHRSVSVTAPKPSNDLEAGIAAVIAACDGDPRAAVRALLIANSYLEAEVERLARAVSTGFVRGLTRSEPPPGLRGVTKREQSDDVRGLCWPFAGRFRSPVLRRDYEVDLCP
jgi:hypothetical protein